MPTPAVETKALTKTYRLGFSGLKKVEALRGLELTVEPGQLYGLLGPNGAGKSTALKILLGLIHPTSGEARLLGSLAGSSDAKRRLGFLPETPQFYDFLSGREYLAFHASLLGLDTKTANERIGRLLEMTGVAHAANLRLRRYSKGMIQRLGLSQALLGDPELVILDEPTSGLDPVGRRHMKDMLLALRAQGKTVLFSTHIIPDVEATCDRVAILIDGKVSREGTVGSLLHGEVKVMEAVLGEVAPAFEERLKGGGALEVTRTGTGVRALVKVEDVSSLLDATRNGSARLVSLTPHQYSLEDVFIQEWARSKKGTMEPI